MKAHYYDYFGTGTVPWPSQAAQHSPPLSTCVCSRMLCTNHSTSLDDFGGGLVMVWDDISLEEPTEDIHDCQTMRPWVPPGARQCLLTNVP